MNGDLGASDDVTELMVTLSFPLAIDAPADVGPRELATKLRDRWVEEPDVLGSVVEQALVDDYDVQVRLFDEP